jgi:hypothetical protein
MECKLCHAVSTDDEAGLCSLCWPDECFECGASYVYYENGYFKCSHDCEYSVNEYLSKRFFTEVVNGSPSRKLAFAGPRVECIIPNGTSICPKEEPSSTRSGSINVLHYTENKEEILDEGFRFQQSSSSHSIRENAAYGWPYKERVCDEKLSWEYYPCIFLEVPESEVRVSSYSFLEIISENYSEYEYSIPPSKYESELIFEPSVLRKACREFNRPVEPNELLI